MQERLIGRKAEQERLNEYLKTDRSEFVVVYGRRRVGKTFLVRQTIGDTACFQMTGMENVGIIEQLTNFFLALRKVFPSAHRPTSWLEAFDQLEQYLETLATTTKVIFLDELPWMDTPRSRFVSALEHFWNSWASARTDIKLIACGSAASWMLDNLINNHGGLHNRVTHQILLKPFTLGECQEYFDHYGFAYGKLEIAECYMAMGGIPYYLSLMDRRESVAQNIDRMLFSATGELRAEKDNLFRSLFKHSDDYMIIVHALASKGIGLTRGELIEMCKLDNNARLTKMLTELENCQFIRKYIPFGKNKRTEMYQLIDPFMLFAFKILDKKNYQDNNYWVNNINSPAYNAWSGLAFEMLCLNHVPQIKKALKIEGVQTSVFCWRTPAKAEYGVQIDLLIKRADHCVNLCEMKYSRSPYALSKSEHEKIEQRVRSFIEHTRTRDSVIVTMITACGLARNAHTHVAQCQLQLNDLF